MPEASNPTPPLAPARVRIVGTGICVPPIVQTSEELAAQTGRSAPWIVARTGVRARRVADEPMDRMAARAIREALGDGPLPDLLVNASLTPVQLVPDSSVFILHRLGWEGLPSFSVHATCMSFLVGLQTAAAWIATGAARRVVVVSAEQGSVSRDFAHPESAALIGDGAAAAVIEPTPEGEDSALLAWRMSTWPEGRHLAEVPGLGTRRPPFGPNARPDDALFRMQGPRLYRLALRRVQELVDDLLRGAGLAREDIDLVVPHQPSGPAVASISRHLGFPPERVVDIVAEYGNCIAASTPMALHDAVVSGRLRRGMRVLLLGTGAGVHVAGAVLRY